MHPGCHLGRHDLRDHRDGHRHPDDRHLGHLARQVHLGLQGRRDLLVHRGHHRVTVLA